VTLLLLYADSKAWKPWTSGLVEDDQLHTPDVVKASGCSRDGHSLSSHSSLYRPMTEMEQQFSLSVKSTMSDFIDFLTQTCVRLCTYMLWPLLYTSVALSSHNLCLFVFPSVSRYHQQPISRTEKTLPFSFLKRVLIFLSFLSYPDSLLLYPFFIPLS
jgi:hypothetical protein